MEKLEAPNEKEDAAGAAEEGALDVCLELEVGRAEKENPELAGLLELLELVANETEGVPAAGALDGAVDAAAGFPKLKLGRDVGVLDAAVGDEPLVAGWNGVAVWLRVLVPVDEAAGTAEEDDADSVSALLRCLRYWSLKDSIRRVRSAKGSASSCSLIFWLTAVWKERFRPRSKRSFSFSPDEDERV